MAVTFCFIQNLILHNQLQFAGFSHFFSSSFVVSVGGTSFGCRAKNRTIGPALQQANSLLSELSLTLPICVAPSLSYVTSDINYLFYIDFKWIERIWCWWRQVYSGLRVLRASSQLFRPATRNKNSLRRYSQFFFNKKSFKIQSFNFC